jgi:hypothetical protein
MAKKKGKSNGNSDTAERSDAAEVQTVEEPTTTTEKSEPQQLQDTPVEDMDVEDLRAELSLARAGWRKPLERPWQHQHVDVQHSSTKNAVL